MMPPHSTKTHQSHIHIRGDDEQMLAGCTLEGRKSQKHGVRRERAEQIRRDSEKEREARVLKKEKHRLHQTQEVTKVSHALMRVCVN